MRLFLHNAAAAMLLYVAGASPVLAGEVVEVRISDLAFAPTEITIHAGDSIRWVNHDIVDHTATAAQGDFDLSLPVGKAGVRQFGKPGSYKYFCRFHPNMMGSVNVLAVDKGEQGTKHR
jgi:plastocyanin